MPRERACPKGRRRVSEGRYRTTQEDCKRTELAVEISDDSNAPLRTMEPGVYPSPYEMNSSYGRIREAKERENCYPKDKNMSKKY